MKKIILAVLLLGTFQSANAVLITETWESEITFATHNAFAVGDTFTWTVTYDDSSLRMHGYSDGANGIGEFGEGDDTLNHVYCTGTESNGAGCTTSTGSSHSFLSDAIFDLSNFYDVMAVANLTGYDYYTSNNALRYNTSSGNEYADFLGDDMHFTLSRAVTWSSNTIIYDSITLLNSQILNREIVDVPAPTSIALLVLGLTGVGFSRRKKIA